MRQCDQNEPSCDAKKKLKLLRLIVASGLDVPESFAAMVAILEPEVCG